MHTALLLHLRTLVAQVGPKAKIYTVIANAPSNHPSVRSRTRTRGEKNVPMLGRDPYAIVEGRVSDDRVEALHGEVDAMLGPGRLQW